MNLEEQHLRIFRLYSCFRFSTIAPSSFFRFLVVMTGPFLHAEKYSDWPGQCASKSTNQNAPQPVYGPVETTFFKEKAFHSSSL